MVFPSVCFFYRKHVNVGWYGEASAVLGLFVSQLQETFYENRGAALQTSLQNGWEINDGHFTVIGDL